MTGNRTSIDTDGATRVASNQEPSHQPSVREVDLDSIKDRQQAGSRRINTDHVRYLVDGILASDLLHPVVVDKTYRLLAGGHRLAALHKMRSDHPHEFSRKFPGGFVPVRVIQIDAEQDPSAAWAIEVAENQMRRAYTPAETARVAQQLRTLGYRDSRGRPKPGEKPLMTALAVIMGQSNRTARRKLDAASGPKTDIRTNVRISNVERDAKYALRTSSQLRRVAMRYRQLGEQAQPLSDALTQAAEALARFAARLAADQPLAVTEQLKGAADGSGR